jgi:hypothetical protein
VGQAAVEDAGEAVTEGAQRLVVSIVGSRTDGSRTQTSELSWRLPRRCPGPVHPAAAMAVPDH